MSICYLAQFQRGRIPAVAQLGDSDSESLMRLQSGCRQGCSLFESLTPLSRRPTYIAVGRRPQLFHRATLDIPAPVPHREQYVREDRKHLSDHTSAFYDLVLEVTCSFCALQVESLSPAHIQEQRNQVSTLEGNNIKELVNISLKPPQVILLRCYFSPNLLIQCNPNKTSITFFFRIATNLAL